VITRNPIRWVISLVLVLVGIQFVPASRTNPPEKAVVMAPPEVHDLLVRACFDCHSHRTVWPWYSRVAPVSWLVAHHVEDGRADLNFSEWPVFDLEEKELYLRDIENQLVKGEMPPGYYKIAHAGARLTDEEVALLLAWARDR
jgi:hypothetical protein